MYFMTNNSPFRYELLHADARTAARLGRLHTPRGIVELPTFMPVGTLGTVKGVDIRRVRETGAQIILANTYHLALRPGEETVAALGDLHAFTGWQGPILTDSGGFQVFSLADRMKVSEEGVEFRSHIDGSKIQLSPERSIAIQEALGSDFIMAFDQVVALPNESSVVEEATWRSVRWAERCQRASRRSDQMLLAIVQGGLDPGLRRRCAHELVAMEFQGYAVGGLSVGEPPAEMYAALDVVVPELPADRPRYLMGVGRPQDLIEGVARGIDMFDCVMPTRNGRNALVFTDAGPVRLRNASHERDRQPIEAGCPCPACEHSRGYLRHLFQSGEMLGPILASIHNLTYYQRLMARAREAIAAGSFAEFRAERMRGWNEPS
ncbi:Queuine tRNA-ribosyltransferase [Lacipirellula limnantheis]|uniref:Queuine tRNA-ribosyltransferase n=2 Tax=Lacipirellula limnantheis TaxID=2528024 RepID=A0A517U2Y0_9BACT|nr:Queuine tRNA-ribosyltransferase [Lacipirellula limnantheis]